MCMEISAIGSNVNNDVFYGKHEACQILALNCHETHKKLDRWIRIVEKIIIYKRVILERWATSYIFLIVPTIKYKFSFRLAYFYSFFSHTSTIQIHPFYSFVNRYTFSVGIQSYYTCMDEQGSSHALSLFVTAVPGKLHGRDTYYYERDVELHSRDMRHGRDN